MSKPPLDLDYATPGQDKPLPPQGNNPPMAKAVRMVAYAIVILAGAILAGFGSLENVPGLSAASCWGGLIMATGALMLIISMIR
jgi:hypothetical protein